jgi:hypothetical protein
LQAYQQAPLVLPAAVPVALPEPARHVGAGMASYTVQPLTIPPPQPAVDEDATDEELLALLLSS